MASRDLSPVLRFLRALPVAPGAAAAPDCQLLQHFAREGDEAAFAELVRRHGPMVLGVCRRLLRDGHDAEDAFQATFLVLVRKARSLSQPELMGNWLYGVAYRTALKARARGLRRRARQRPLVDVPAPVSLPEWIGAEVRAVLDEEVQRLPDKYRVAFVLCCLEGKTNAEAARLLGCPKGTILSRLAWARARLRARLTRRGLALSAPALAPLLSQTGTSVAVGPALAAATIQAGMQWGVAEAVGGVISEEVATLAEGVLKAMFLAKVRLALLFLAVVLIIGAGVGIATSRLGAEPTAAANEQPSQAPAGEKANAAQRLTARAVALTFDTNEAAVEENLLGKEVEVQGTVKRIFRTKTNGYFSIGTPASDDRNVFVLMMAASDNRLLYFIFPEDARKALAKLQADQEVIVKGKCLRWIAPSKEVKAILFDEAQLIHGGR
jgi:RNA polymerase sigma factor (sigma-70 family)